MSDDPFKAWERDFPSLAMLGSWLLSHPDNLFFGRSGGPLAQELARALSQADKHQRELTEIAIKAPVPMMLLQPSGWRLVPVEPTPEMVEAGALAASSVPIPNTAEIVWRAMNKAAPTFTIAEKKA